MSKVTAVLVAAAALAALCVPPSVASAEEGGNPVILPEPSEASPLRFTSKSVGKIRLAESGAIVECESGTSEGKFTSRRLGTISVVFKHCVFQSTTCQNHGGEAGVISFTNADAHLVTFGSLSLGLVISLAGGVPVECWLGSEFRGSLIGVMSGGLETWKTSATLTFEQASGEQFPDECNLDKEFCLSGEAHKVFQLQAIGGLTAKDLGVLRTDEVKFGSEVLFLY